MRIPMTSFDALLALEENKKPKKKPPLMAHQKRPTSLVHVILLKPLPLPNNYDSRKNFHNSLNMFEKVHGRFFETKAIAVAGRLGQSHCCSILNIHYLHLTLAP